MHLCCRTSQLWVVGLILINLEGEINTCVIAVRANTFCEAVAVVVSSFEIACFVLPFLHFVHLMPGHNSLWNWTWQLSHHGITRRIVLHQNKKKNTLTMPFARFSVENKNWFLISCPCIASITRGTLRTFEQKQFSTKISKIVPNVLAADNND